MLLPGLRRRLSEVLRRPQVDAEMDEELRHHVELDVAERMRAGLDEREARRQARLAVGGIDDAREMVAEGRTGHTLEAAGREVTHAARTLRRSPGLTLVSVLTIGVGIGLCGTVFALVDAVVLSPLPYPAPDRLVRIVDVNPQAGVDRAGVASGNVYEWRRRTDAFEGIAGYYAMGRTISGDGPADVVIAAQVSQDFFTVAGVQPIAGRTFTADETERATYNNAAAPTGTDPVVILSFGLWQSRFNRDPGVVGRTITIERRPFRIVGVMPEQFALPDPDVQAWIPWHLSAANPHDQHYLGSVARLAHDVSVEEAEQRLARVAEELGREFPDSNKGWSVRVLPLREDTVGNAGTLLWLLSGAAALLLLVACANVALLALIRGMDRAGETAVRLALGAGPGRLMREFLFESVLLALAGGLVGAGLAVWALNVLPEVVADLPRLDEVRFDGRTWGFVLLATTSAAILSGVPQAWRRTRMTPVDALSDGGLRTTGGRHHHRLRDALAVTQVAFAVVLLVGAALLGQSVWRLAHVDSGFDPRGVLVAPVFLDSQAYGSGDRARAYYQDLFSRLSALPEVLAVGGSTTVPTSPLGPDFERPVWPAGTLPLPAERTPASVRMVTPGYFAAMGLRIVAGRPIDDRDQPTTPRVLMINETLAGRLWPGRSPVGQQLVVDYSTVGTYPYDVIGIVADSRFRGPRSEPVPEIFLPHAQRPYLILNVVVKTAGDPRALMPAVRDTLRDLDPDKPAHALTTLDDLLQTTYVRDRQAMATLLVFAGAAVLLALLSVYGVLSQRIRDSRRELGIRLAIGADARSLVRWVTHGGVRLVAWGIAIGVATAWSASSAVDGLLYGVSPTDAWTVVAVSAFVLVVGLAATLVPAWRAARIDPIAVLRQG